MSLTQLVYASRPFGFDQAVLSNILMDARRANARDDITGALIARHDLYLQLLEGPPDKVEAAYQRIRHDDRHVEVTRLVEHPIETRLFPGWTMRDDPAQSWVWSIEDVRAGAIERDEAGPEALGFFERLASTE
ncbi:BLUF domain-containing protein [uncultured Roseovarius sp.]|uniref:BLUF domain-containing protein n=1 Tax=uncultured Roseovarius sp. TaxID=293344 RepID=UPI00263823A9|nr:BLUF domain-containing protein [uncultured Roseovarius sp.]